VKRLLQIIIIAALLAPFLLYGVGHLIQLWKRVHIKNEFYIEYSESCNSIGLHNEMQNFLCDIQEAYWNNDSLVISGTSGCFLIEFEKTYYNDEMIKINCGELNQIIKKKPIEKYIKDKG